MIFFSRNNVTYTIRPTNLRLDSNYQYYYISWFRSILLFFIPLILLSGLNGKIIYQLHGSDDSLTSNRVSFLLLTTLVIITVKISTCYEYITYFKIQVVVKCKLIVILVLLLFNEANLHILWNRKTYLEPKQNLLQDFNLDLYGFFFQIIGLQNQLGEKVLLKAKK